MKLEEKEWVSLINCLVAAIGYDKAYRAAVDSLGYDRVRDFLGGKRPRLSKNDTRRIIKELWNASPGTTREQKVEWAIGVAMRAFPSHDRFHEVLDYVERRIAEHEAIGWTLDSPPEGHEKEPLRWRNDVAYYSVLDGVKKFYTRNLREPTVFNAGETREFIICRAAGVGFSRMLLMLMNTDNGVRAPSRIFCEGAGYVEPMYENPFPVPLTEVSEWTVERSEDRHLQVKLFDKVIWKGRYLISSLDGLVMGGYPGRGLGEFGEWAVEES